MQVMMTGVGVTSLAGERLRVHLQKAGRIDQLQYDRFYIRISARRLSIIDWTESDVRWLTRQPALAFRNAVLYPKMFIKVNKTVVENKAHLSALGRTTLSSNLALLWPGLFTTINTRRRQNIKCSPQHRVYVYR